MGSRRDTGKIKVKFRQDMIQMGYRQDTSRIQAGYKRDIVGIQADSRLADQLHMKVTI